MTGWAIDAGLASALLMAAVLLIRIPVRRLFGPTVAYALWALPALRLVMPPLSWPSVPGSPIVGAADGVSVLLAVPLAPIATLGEPTGPAGMIVAIAWFVGAASFLVHQIVAHHLFCRRITDEAVATKRLGDVRVVISAAAAGPLAFGVWRRTIAFPLDFDRRYGADERALALAHELGHHERGDLLANWAALGMLAIHWFNPVAWLAFQAFRADQELATDARVLRLGPALDRSIYAGAIVKAALGRAVSPACNLHSIANLKRRLTMLARSPISRRRRTLGNLTVATLVGSGLVLTASGAGSTSTVRSAAEAGSVTQSSVAPASGGRQLRTIVVRRDGAGEPRLIVRGVSVAPDAPLPGGAVLPGTFELPADCRTERAGAPRAFVIKGEGGEETYTVLCTRAAPATSAADGSDIERDAYRQALAGLRDLRINVSAKAQPGFPEAERRHVFAVIDGSIAELEGDLAALR